MRLARRDQIGELSGFAGGSLDHEQSIKLRARSSKVDNGQN